MATLLDLCISIARRLPLSASISGVVGNSEPLVQQLLELCQEEGDELMQGHEWSRLITTWQFDIDADPHDEAFPSDYDRLLTDADFWRSGSDITPLAGPVNPDNWHYLQGVAGTYPGYWRPYGQGVQILGVPTDESCDIEYISKNWIIDEDGETGKAAFDGDDDTIIFDENLFKSGVRWRWKQSKGLDYAEDMATYERNKEKRIAADRSARPVSTRRRQKGAYSIEDFAWPGQVIEN